MSIPQLELRNEEKTNKEATKFFDWAFNNGDKAASDLGYVPLPKETKDAIRKYWETKGIK